ncbi:MAG TPA: sigma-70 family RNA polymerase sigma factor [Candidatus Baltobacteraceae bacterium]
MEDASLLMARVVARDTKAFEQLYDAYGRLVYGIALRMLGDVGAAEDVTQAVFLKIWTAPERFREGNFAGWIARVSRNRALDVLRSVSAHATAELPETLPEDEPMEATAFANLDAIRVRRALAELPPEQRDPIEMGFFGGLTHEEMARRSGVPLGTIKTRIRSGLGRLRAALSESVTV